MKLYSRAGPKSCKKESRDPPLCTKQEAISGENLNNPDVEARQDFWKTVGDDISRNHVAPRMILDVPKADFPIPLNHIFCPETKKRALMDFMRQPSI